MVKTERFAVQHFLPAERKKPRPQKNALGKFEMKIYFDTNVYRLIRARNELRPMRKLLKAHKCTLTASSGNLFETFAIMASDEAHAELEVLTRLADKLEARPQSWLHAVELRNELRCLRPTWLRSVASTRQSQRFLRAHCELWETARRRVLPPSHAYQQYRADVERGITDAPPVPEGRSGRPSSKSTPSFTCFAFGRNEVGGYLRSRAFLAR